MTEQLLDRQSHISSIAEEVFGYEVEAARQTANLGYMARVMAQVTLPHSRPTTNEYTRHNGRMTLSMWSPEHIGLPYGGVPRLLIAWLTTEAVRTRQRTLTLGPTLSGFMGQLGLVPTGGRWGTIPRLQQQIRRLFATQIVCTYDDQNHSVGSSLGVASEYELWWNPKSALVMCHCESVDSGILNSTVESFDRHFAVNARATWLLIREFGLRYRSTFGSGRIVALTSDHTVGNLPYGASKAALDRITIAAAREFATKGITANVINPGPTDTGWMTPSLKSRIVSETPLDRIGTPEDAARLVSFLCSPEGQWVNGQLLHSDGGFSS